MHGYSESLEGKLSGSLGYDYKRYPATKATFAVVEVVHGGREANFLAHELARAGMSLPAGYLPLLRL